jgi:N-acetylmuramoyl-L-alanine amidase
MKRSLRLAGITVLGILWLCGFAFGQDPRRRAESPRLRASAPKVKPPSRSNVNDGEPARLKGVRLVSSESNTRVLMEVTQPVRYAVGSLPADAAKGLPPRIYVDISGAKIALDSPEPVNMRDGLIKQVRVGQFDQDTVRVVVEVTSLTEHRAFLLPKPFRVVLEFPGSKTATLPVDVVQAKASLPAPASVKNAKPRVAGIRKIVLDPGHGGKDPGAIGPGGIAEKDIVLSVAEKLAVKLKKEMGIEVVLTRHDDRFIPLEDRTAIANAENADLFISLHMNASPNSEARGVETYYLDNTSDEASMRLAARENSTSRKNVSDLQFILSDMTQNMKLEDSVTLAHRLQASLVGTLGNQLADIKDLGVKKALFYVLVGARMPSVLLEMFFITNRNEGRAMSRKDFQDAVTDALYDGIQQYNHSAVATKTL